MTICLQIRQSFIVFCREMSESYLLLVVLLPANIPLIRPERYKQNTFSNFFTNDEITTCNNADGL